MRIAKMIYPNSQALIQKASEQLTKTIQWTIHDSINGYPPQISNPEDCIIETFKDFIPAEYLVGSPFQNAIHILNLEANARLCGGQVIFLNSLETTLNILDSFQKYK